MWTETFGIIQTNPNSIDLLNNARIASVFASSVRNAVLVRRSELEGLYRHRYAKAHLCI